MIVHTVEQDFAVLVATTQATVVQIQPAVEAHHRHVVGAERTEAVIQLGVLVVQFLYHVNRIAAPRHHLVNIF